MEVLCQFKEPLKQEYDIKIALIDVNNILIPVIQRDISKTLLKKLERSIEKVWFVEPIIVIPSSVEEGKYEVINWQHRLEVFKKFWWEKIPAIILPSKIKQYIIDLNIEKWPTLKEKAHQAYVIYQEALNKYPELNEFDLAWIIDYPYYITVWYVIDKYKENKIAAWAFERLLSKVDNWIEKPLKEASEERNKRAIKLIEANNVLNEKMMELGLKNALLKWTIVNKAFQQVFGIRTRIIEDDYMTAFDKIIQWIKNLQLTEEEINKLNNMNTEFWVI